MKDSGDFLIYQTENGVTKIDVRIQDDTVWLTQQQMAELYQSSKSNVSEHIAETAGEPYTLDEKNRPTPAANDVEEGTQMTEKPAN